MRDVCVQLHLDFAICYNSNRQNNKFVGKHAHFYKQHNEMDDSSSKTQWKSFIITNNYFSKVTKRCFLDVTLQHFDVSILNFDDYLARRSYHVFVNTKMISSFYNFNPCSSYSSSYYSSHYSSYYSSYSSSYSLNIMAISFEHFSKQFLT